MRNLKKWASKPISFWLRQERLRNRLAFELKQSYYEDLLISVPVGRRLGCPVTNPEHWFSFAEVFVQQEYKEAFETIPLPKRWLDIGCHAGYFSLFVAWLWEVQSTARDFQALLLDADPRVISAVDKLIEENDLGEQMSFQHGLIATGAGDRRFAMKEVMASAVAGDEDRSVVAVPIISQAEIMKLFPPPYDLIKIDIEGAEYEFLTGYVEVIDRAQHILLEWHSWHTGGGGRQQIKTRVEQLGLSIVKEITAAHTVTHLDQPAECGVLLLRNEGA